MSAAIDARLVNMSARDEMPLPRLVVPTLLTAAALLGLLFAGRAVRPALDRPLDRLEIDGALTRLKPEQIAAAAAVPPRTPIFEPDLDALRQRIEALPWVAHARVSRVWPSRLSIHVWERVPFARWCEKSLLDTENNSFTPPARDLEPKSIQSLPQLWGPPGREADVTRAYQGLSAALKNSVFVPNGLALDARGEWRMSTVRGITLRLGDGDPLSHNALILGTVSRALADSLDGLDYIDLRYTNGFATGLKAASNSPVAPIVSPAGPLSPTDKAADPADDTSAATQEPRP